MAELTNELTIGKEEFKALSSDTRIEIIKLLNARNYTLSELSAKMKMSSPTIKQHLETLMNSDLIQQKDEGRKWKYYSLTRKGKKIIEPESQNVMILLGATIVGCIFILYILAGANLMGLTGTEMNDSEKQGMHNEAYPELSSDAARGTTETIQEILGKSEEITGIEFDLVEKANGTTTESKYYLKKEKYRKEMQVQEKKIVEIFDGKNLHVFSLETGLFPSQEETGEKLNSAAEKDPAGIHEVAMQATGNPSLKETGMEDVNGMNTRIIEYSYNEQKIKAWISEEYGIPVKKLVQVQTGQGLMQKTTELTNIKIGQVSDSLFETN